jgi:hypothetical protein
MRKILFATAGLAILSAPALAQSPSGASRADTAPTYWGNGDGYYSGGCRLVEDRVVTQNGQVIVRRHRDCD